LMYLFCCGNTSCNIISSDISSSCWGTSQSNFLINGNTLPWTDAAVASACTDRRIISFVNGKRCDRKLDPLADISGLDEVRMYVSQSSASCPHILEPLMCGSASAEPEHACRNWLVVSSAGSVSPVLKDVGMTARYVKVHRGLLLLMFLHDPQTVSEYKQGCFKLPGLYGWRSIILRPGDVYIQKSEIPFATFSLLPTVAGSGVFKRTRQTEEMLGTDLTRLSKLFGDVRSMWSRVGFDASRTDQAWEEKMWLDSAP